MKRKVVSLMLLFALILGQITTFSNVSYASNEETYDYKEFLKTKIRNKYDKDLNTPTPVFTITADGKMYKVRPDTKIDEPYMNRGEVPYLKDKNGNELVIPIGTSIKLDAGSSQVGSGNKISQYDWQIYKAYDDKEKKYVDGMEESNKKSLEFMANKPGDYLIFLNVADNYSKVKNFSNWSEKGDWRSEIIKPMDYPGVIIKGWYFTVAKIKVVDSNVLIAEFEIWHNGKNVTNNEKNPVVLKSYPTTIQLKDKSQSKSSKIIEWHWEYRVWPSGKWIFFSTEQNPTLKVNPGVIEIRLRVTCE